VKCSRGVNKDKKCKVDGTSRDASIWLTLVKGDVARWLNNPSHQQGGLILGEPGLSPLGEKGLFHE
jgi:hypothetical protein